MLRLTDPQLLVDPPMSRQSSRLQSIQHLKAANNLDAFFFVDLCKPEEREIETKNGRGQA